MLKLVQPVPLYFEVMDSDPTKEHIVMDVLADQELTVAEIVKRAGISRESVYRALKVLLVDSVTKSPGTRPVLYRRILR